MLDSQSADIDGHSDQHPAGPKEAAQAFLWAVWAEPGARTDERFIFIHMRHDHHPLPKQNKKSTRIPCSTSPQQKHTSQMIKYSNTHTHIQFSLFAGKNDLECFLFRSETHFFLKSFCI